MAIVLLLLASTECPGWSEEKISLYFYVQVSRCVVSDLLKSLKQNRLSEYHQLHTLHCTGPHRLKCIGHLWYLSGEEREACVVYVLWLKMNRTR